MGSTIERIDTEIHRLEVQIEELKAARNVVLRVEGSANLATCAIADAEVPNDCAGRTIFDCCYVVLSEAAQAHFHEIADRAVARGYSSNRGSSPTSTRRSFFDILRRNPDTFEPVGKGIYRLARSADASGTLGDAAMLDPWVDLGAAPSAEAMTTTASLGEPILPHPIVVDESDVGPE